MEMQKNWSGQNVFEKEQGGFGLNDFKTCYKVTVMKTML